MSYSTYLFSTITFIFLCTFFLNANNIKVSNEGMLVALVMITVFSNSPMFVLI